MERNGRNQSEREMKIQRNNWNILVGKVTEKSNQDKVDKARSTNTLLMLV